MLILLFIAIVCASPDCSNIRWIGPEVGTIYGECNTCNEYLIEKNILGSFYVECPKNRFVLYNATKCHSSNIVEYVSFPTKMFDCSSTKYFYDHCCLIRMVDLTNNVTIYNTTFISGCHTAACVGEAGKYFQAYDTDRFFYFRDDKCQEPYLSYHAYTICSIAGPPSDAKLPQIVLWILMGCCALALFFAICIACIHFVFRRHRHHQSAVQRLLD